MKSRIAAILIASMALVACGTQADRWKWIRAEGTASEPALQAAMAECRAAADNDGEPIRNAGGVPVRSAFEACMYEKGYAQAAAHR